MREWRVDVSISTFLKALGVVLVVWLWLRLWQWVLVFVIGAFLAVALDPLMEWLERRRLKRVYAAPLVVMSGVVALGLLLAVSGASLSQEARLLSTRVSEAQDSALGTLPPEIADRASSILPGSEWLAQAGAALIGGVLAIGVALVLAIYLLIDGRRTYRWLLAFVPRRYRDGVEEVVPGAREVIVAFVHGNLITSALATVFTWIALVALGVPAALLLAIIAGVLDLIPVIGFFLSAAPAILLAATVSPGVALAVTAFYIAYNLFENYVVQPKVFGRELRLSDLAVIISFLVGAELGGVLGAVVALPLAALYPHVERAWAARAGRPSLPAEHRSIEAEGRG